jgi:hypothetical protein
MSTEDTGGSGGVVEAPAPAFKLSNQNVVVSNGGSAYGQTAVIKIKNGREVAFQSVPIGTVGGGVSQTHHPIWHDENGVEHIRTKEGKHVKLSEQNFNIVRRESANRG